ncbi:hypothetical protein [Rhizobium sp. L18]|uniref:hypothetical protein n=1 Tax=Rhizobium sp. L18 TaxID=2035451 RepID=UPI0015CF5D8F|nr:hypothetical protein [Rhizobium sp. L18]
MLSEEVGDPVEGDLVHPVVQIRVAGNGYDHQLLRLRGSGEGRFGEVGEWAFAPWMNRTGRGEISAM